MTKKVMPTSASASSVETTRRALFVPGSDLPYKLSRSKLELFIQCPCCFYLDRRCGVARPDGPPFSLNVTVDLLLKREFDVCRERGETHTLMASQGIDAIPLRHPAIDEWRDAMRGIRYLDPKTHFLVFGAVDDIWLNPAGQMIVVDYKATSSVWGASITQVTNPGYRRQIEVYQWLLRRNGFDVSDTAYFVYANADKDRASFDMRLEFSIRIIPYRSNDAWVPDALQEAKTCLLRDTPPQSSATCDWCRYRKEGMRVEIW